MSGLEREREREREREERVFESVVGECMIVEKGISRERESGREREKEGRLSKGGTQWVCCICKRRQNKRRRRRRRRSTRRSRSMFSLVRSLQRNGLRRQNPFQRNRNKNSN